jgi:predicted secreted protein
MTTNAKTGLTVALLCAAFSVLAVAFLSDSGGARRNRPAIALVDTNFLDTSTTRKSYADLVRAGADLSDFDCYVCHDKKSPPPLRFDANLNIIVAEEHIGPSQFSEDDIGANELEGLVERFRRHSDPVSTFVWQSLSNSQQLLLTNYKPSEQSSKQAREIVLSALNNIITNAAQPFYEPGRFNEVLLGAETMLLMQQNPTGCALAHLNRLLLEDAYPVELSRNRQNDIVMGHGKHGRNNNCFNCHNETNLTLLQPRDGRDLTFADSTQLCGSCHGPTYRDWLAGAHGRISGYWDRGSSPFSEDEIRDLPKLADRLSHQSDPVSGFVWQQLSKPGQVLLANYQPSASNSKPAQDVVLQVLNKIIGEPSIYQPDRFKGILLAPETASLMQQGPQDTNSARLNRLLLEDAFPMELTRNQRRDCVNCHNPHAPPFPSRKPAPGPHPLREMANMAESQTARK